ncbi:hypothetical protein EM20IM_07770 [Candidatus Methylacidiphilum infernorum]|uniref:Serine kinase of the HPr protein, regulates carbohydrate metabolism n=1 Tax=Candidatus Methylacidiphilum infernorum TaxID=511746 RepID=A0ABX7PTT1_9BACT|nr:hypothetical protein [Candidatus Methylacidiphilum infernorum]QSR86390.1 hypothetical protein EM20IM_07770 [Candidatus Methylacidiphilum infernorum]
MEGRDLNTEPVGVGYGLGLYNPSNSPIKEWFFSGPILWGNYPFNVSCVDSFPLAELGKPLFSMGPLSLFCHPRRILVGDLFLFSLQPGQLFFAYRSFDLEKFKYYFYQVVLPLFGQCLGKLLFLHGGAFEVQSQAVGLVAASGGGKSTLLSAFQEQGYPLVADDRIGFVVESEEPSVVPSHPFLRNYRKPEEIGRPVSLFAREILPLKSIFFLRWTDKDEPWIEKVEPSKAFRNLYLNSSFVLDERVHAQKILKWLTRIKTYRLFLPQGKRETIPQACAMILSKALER